MEYLNKLLNEDEVEGLMSISMDVDGTITYKFDDGTIKIVDPRE